METIPQETFFKHDSLKSLAALLKVSTKTLSGRIKDILPHYKGKKIGKLYPKDLKTIYFELID